MAKYVALIRGIGPGDPRKSNESLRGVLEALGFKKVQSVISSGNIIFESGIADTAELEELIESAWPRMLGFEAATIVRREEQLRALLERDPFEGIAHRSETYQLITFFKRSTEVGFDLPYQPPDKPYRLVGFADNALFTITDATTLVTTDLMVWLERQYGKDITSRTPLTIRRILKKMEVFL